MGEGDGGVDEDDGVVGVDRRHTMIAPAAFRRHRERGGESPPPSSSLTSPLDGRRVSPLVHGLHGGGGAGAPPRLDLSHCFSSVSRSCFWPKTVSYIPGEP
jgi:hypothetical protein